MDIKQFKYLKQYLSTINFFVPHTWHSLYLSWVDNPGHKRFGLKRFAGYCKDMGVGSTTQRFDGKPRKMLTYDPINDKEAIKLIKPTEICDKCKGRGILIITDTTVVK